MAKIVISVENLTKSYQLGVIDSRTLAKSLNRRWARWRGKPDPYLKIGQEDLSTRRGEMILALDDVSFTVRQGEALGIIGGNGAGKSTLLKILSQVTAPTSGRIRVKGRVGSLLEVGTGFHPELTGRENMYLNGAILGMTRAEVDRKFDEIVDFSGVEQFIDTPVKRYSSGMKVRLGFAVAAHLDPEILIVDEVLAVGDAEFQKKCLGKMGAVAGEGRTVLFVSHNMDAVNKLCKNAILIDSGKLKSSGEVDYVTALYLNNKFSGSYKAPKNKQGHIHISQLWFSNTEGVEKETFENGEPIVVNVIVENLNYKTFEIELSFWDKHNNKLWSFTHANGNFPSISVGPKAKIRLTFFVPKMHSKEIYVHAGIHLPNQGGSHYVENITEGIRFFIDEFEQGIFTPRSTLFSCPVELTIEK